MTAQPPSKVAAWARHTTYVHAARVFIEACEAEGIPVLPVKGLVSALTLYADPSERSMFDIDFRVRRSDHDRVGALIRKRGWPMTMSSRAYASHTTVVEDVEIDVEGYIGPPHICDLRVDDVLARATRSAALGFPALLPDFDDHAVLLVVNVFKDKLDRARPWAIRDVIRLGKHPRFDARTLATRLQAARITTIGWIVADWLAAEHDAPEWMAVRSALAPAHATYARAFTFARRWPDALPMRILARLSADRPTDSARALAHALWWQLEQTR